MKNQYPKALDIQTIKLAWRLYYNKETILATPTLIRQLDPKYFAVYRGRIWPTKLLTATLKHLASQDAV